MKANKLNTALSAAVILTISAGTIQIQAAPVALNENDPELANLAGYANESEQKNENITVTFMANGGYYLLNGTKAGSIYEFQPRNNAGGTYYFELPEEKPVRDGYHFDGYNTKIDGSGLVFTDQSAVREDMTVYAIWTKQSIAEGNEYGWNRQPDGNWKYLLSDGDFAEDGIYDIGGTCYAFDDDGIMLTGMIQLEAANGFPAGTYYFQSNGAMVTGWAKTGGSWYYFNVDGRMRTGWLPEGDTWYYLQPDGKMTLGWEEINERWYYFDSAGVMKKGWMEANGNWYYFNSATGEMLHQRWIKDGDNYYFFSSDGAMKTGWMTQGGVTYFFSEDGSMKTGWMRASSAGDWYYFDLETGNMLKNKWLTLDDDTYYFKADGLMARSAWVRVRGKYFYMMANGKMAKDVNLSGYKFDKDGVCTNYEERTNQKG